MSRAASQRGFTIIEVLIALVVMMIGVAGVLAMHATSSRASSGNGSPPTRCGETCRPGAATSSTSECRS